MADPSVKQRMTKRWRFSAGGVQKTTEEIQGFRPLPLGPTFRSATG
ncbi:hypothetical protein [Methylacidimicrobium sp. B4]|nr:hypothetical protein [Methylacidimicrobium sp. B4]QSR84511.1 hypothetical protein MacB4_09965 [Methylacidimicrobium sp. B4]